MLSKFIDKFNQNFEERERERERERDVNVSDSLGYTICIGYV